MSFKIFGTKIYISFFFCAVFTIMLAFDRTGLILPTFFAVLIHEIGHLFAMWMLDCEPKQIRLIPASIQVVSSFSKRYRNDIIVAIFGPLVNFVLFAILIFNYFAFKNEMVLYYAFLNLIIALFNSLPIMGLDGGTVLYSVLAKRGDTAKAGLTVKIITLIIAALIIIFGITLTVRGKFNLSYFIIGIYLFIICLVK